MAQAQLAVDARIPRSWSNLRDLLRSESSEARLLILSVLDRIDAGAYTWAEFGVHDESLQTQQAFIARAEALALFGIVAQSYGLPFGLEMQVQSLAANTDLIDLAADLGMEVNRADLPFLLDVVRTDLALHQEGLLPENLLLPLDILGGMAGRVRDWWEESLAASAEKHGRHRYFGEEDLEAMIRSSLHSAYDFVGQEAEAGVEHGLSLDHLRRGFAA